MPLADQIIGAESGGNATAKNPRSSATGAGQFIASTWLSTVAKHRPDLAGLPRDELLALRNDSGLSREMTQAYADDNGSLLRAAGFEPTPGNTYLAHFAGPAGARAVLGSDPSTPVSAVLDASAISANPFLQGMSAGDLTSWAARKVGGKAPVMTMPGDGSGASAAPGGMPFSLSGPVGSSAPAPVIPAEAAKADTGPDLGAIMKMLSANPEATALQAGATAAPAPAPMPPSARAARPIAFDAKKFFGLLPTRRA